MRQAVNILMLGGAKRVSVARMLKASGKQLGMDVELFSYELSREVPVSEEATIIVGRRWSDPDVMDDLHKVVSENRIDIILPFVDPAIGIAAEFCNAENGCWTPMSDPAMARMLFDKAEADSMFRSLGFPVPAAAEEAPSGSLIIAKPRNGSASKGLKVISAEEYNGMKTSPDCAAYIFQQYIEPRLEVTVDCYVATDNTVVCTVPRKRLAVAGGEVTDTETISNSRIQNLSAEILARLGLKGAITLQFLCQKHPDGSTGDPMLMEINPRLGGGVVCSVHAGADIPGFILADWAGKKLSECRRWRQGVRICRYMQEVVFTPQTQI